MSKIIDFQTNQNTILRVVGDNHFTFFSEVEILYLCLNKEIVLFRDLFVEAIKALQTILNKAIESKLQAIDLDEKKGMGFLWNEYCNKLNTENQDIDDLTAPFHLWSTDSTIGVDTWIYNIGDRILCEISPTYKWHFDEPIDIDYKTYEQFKTKYAPIEIFEIDKNTALDWLKVCEKSLNSI